MNRRLIHLLLLSAVLASAGDLVCSGWKPGTGAVFAGGSDDGSDHSDHDSGGSSGDDHDSDRDGNDDQSDQNDSSGNDGGSDDGGSDDGGSDDGGSDDGGSDDGGSDDGGSDDGGSDGSDASRGGSGGDAVTLNLNGADGIRLFFNNGSMERILAGTYQRIDRRGRILESRPATRTERNRLRAISSNVRAAASDGVTSVVTVNASRQRVEIVDVAGWREMLDKDRYVLTDPNGNVVTRRKASKKDVARVLKMLGRN
ncbi:hypothetical protein [Rhodobacter ferrooxidans]|uniref:Uncharacterized protein n=1 Tax=Rhodobacter ferrooxidans TaxID=371731 RepID=C8RXJ6_9RHOB|nr:hypothetical protein [Rhodobacter sp. SW2]EEW26721.1 hypothetical protein Rsw2DRAFT_0524 [Rhodobacter sp. SW2]